MRGIGIIITPRIEYFEDWHVILTSDFKLKYFRKNQTDYRFYDIIVFQDNPNSTELDASEINHISFKYGSRDYFESQFFNRGLILKEYCEGDLTIQTVTLKYRDNIGFMDFERIFLNEEKSLQNNNKKGKALITSPHLVKLLKYFIINPILDSYQEFCNKSKLESLIKGLSEIREFINNFSAIDTFESYNIDIRHYSITKVGGDDRYYEDKVYSINYLDDYLSQWFKEKSVNLHRESAYTSHFDEVNPYHRFVDEENPSKSLAYANYSQAEHLAKLLSDLLNRLHIKSLDDIIHIKDRDTNRDTELRNFLMKEWHLAEITNWLYQQWYICKRKYIFQARNKCFLESLSLFSLDSLKE